MTSSQPAVAHDMETRHAILFHAFCCCGNSFKALTLHLLQFPFFDQCATETRRQTMNVLSV